MKLKHIIILLLATAAAASLYGNNTSGYSADSCLQNCALRMLNHWDNLDGTVERGYAGRSIFWNTGGIDTARIRQYAEKCRRYGYNATVLNNVNASPKILTKEYLDTVSIYAGIMRQYSIKVFLAVNFASPKALGEEPTADPLDRGVRAWWAKKAEDIYSSIPDFGGFLVKASSEGQPGPNDYGRSHAEGANMLAEVLKPHGGQVIWRAFVYDASETDRAKQAYTEFAKLDGLFLPNVIIQIKNGPIDFQPREPVSPLFFAMHKTRLMAELQITQEYMGHSNHIVFLAPMWREFFEAIRGVPLAGIAGVANIGLDTMTRKLSCGYDLAEYNWQALNNLQLIDDRTDSIAQMMRMSHEACVDYMMPLGLHHLFAWGHHYGPQPWCDIKGARRDWMPAYYHRADSCGIGFDRTMATGSGATAQYPRQMCEMYETLDSCPEKYLLWFHHVPWNYSRRWECNGTTETLWLHLCHHYQRGIDAVRKMKALAPSYMEMLTTQERDAVWWKDACLLYFQTFSHQELPDDVEKPAPSHSLDKLQSIDLGITNYEAPSRQLLDSVR